MTSGAREEALSFACEGETLIGILHHPPAGSACASVGVVVVVGGPQYRAGSHRQFVRLARALASGGHPVLRFDVRGMGDSTGDFRQFQQITADIQASIDALQARAPDVREVALWGLCDGASAALLYLNDRSDPRVSGLCLLNPWVRSEASLARTHVKHYYTRRLREREFWSKLIRGGVALGALRDFVGNLRASRGRGRDRAASALTFQQRMAEPLARLGLPTLLVLSGDDYTAKEFVEFASADPAWSTLLPGLDRRDIEKADHTFSDRQDERQVEQMSLEWLAQIASGARS